MKIKSIDTVYAGYRFRSRLEARWAVFFTAAGIDYQYEPEGFVGLYGEPYLPDFYLPDFGVYAEVKGTVELLRSDWSKIEGSVDFNSTPCSRGLIILGDIPYKEHHIPFFPILYCNKGVCNGYCLFNFNMWNRKADLIRSDNLCMGDTDDLAGDFWCYCGDVTSRALVSEMQTVTADGSNKNFKYFEGSIDLKPKYLTEIEGIDLGIHVNSSLINACYLKARQARFEFGETPA